MEGAIFENAMLDMALWAMDHRIAYMIDERKEIISIYYMNKIFKSDAHYAGAFSLRPRGVMRA